ncbi:MAG: integrase, partial [Desulfobacterales bacterium]|nr:integrase [Desulfobacterales bacterium]
MLKLLRHILIFLLPNIQLTTYLMMDNIVLRHQLSVLQRNAKRPRLRKRDKLFWIMVYRLFKGWKESLVILKPETVIRWHREGFRLFWKFKSKAPK